MTRDESALRQRIESLEATIDSLKYSLQRSEKAQEALRASQGRLNLVTKAAGLGYFDWDPVSGRMEWDSGVERLLSSTSEEDLRQVLEGLRDPSGEPFLECMLDPKDGSAELVVTRNFRMSSHSEGPIDVECRIIRVVGGDGRIIRVLGTCQDVTERRRTEAELRESERRLREAAELAHVGNWWWNVRTGDVEWSEEVYRIFQLDPAEFTPQIDSIMALSPWPEENARDQELIQKTIESRQRGSFEQRFLRPDGSTGYYLSTFEGIYDGDALLAIRGTVQDITDRKRAELDLRRNEENLRVTLDSIGDAVIATDRLGHITRMNRVAETLTGWDLSDALGRPLVDVFRIVNAQTRETAESPVDQVLDTDRIVGLANHTLLLARGGQEYQIADSGAPIRSDNGQTVGVVLVFRDVTEEHALEERLRQSEKMQAIGQLAGGVAHDFNNMLGGIIGSAELLQRYIDDDPTARQLHDLILRSAEQAAGLTQKLLAFSRRQSATARIVDLHGVIQDAISILRHTIDRRIQIDVQLNSSSSFVKGDSVQLQNAFLNLGINASQAMPEGGVITFGTSATTLDSLECEKSAFDIAPGDYIAIEIRDTGHGISTDVLDRIFEPFFTTKGPGEGTGLGMSAVYGTVQHARGAITVESKIGIGTTFTIYLPLVATNRESPRRPEEVIRGTGAVLVVDDEPITRATAETMLSDLGYDVLVAENGRRGVDVYRENQEVIDLVLLDMIMPEMNGLDCFRALKAIDRDVRVVLCSGFAHEQDVVEMEREGLFASIRKPYRQSALSQVVHEALKTRC